MNYVYDAKLAFGQQMTSISRCCAQRPPARPPGSDESRAGQRVCVCRVRTYLPPPPDDRRADGRTSARRRLPAWLRGGLRLGPRASGLGRRATVMVAIDDRRDRDSNEPGLRLPFPCPSPPHGSPPTVLSGPFIWRSCARASSGGCPSSRGPPLPSQRILLPLLQPEYTPTHSLRARTAVGSPRSHHPWPRWWCVPCALTAPHRTEPEPQPERARPALPASYRDSCFDRRVPVLCPSSHAHTGHVSAE